LFDKEGNLMKKIIYLMLLFSLFESGSLLAEQRIRLATTTSTDNSGLLAVLNPPFEQQSGVRVDVIAVGTGRALKLGENGDVDIVMVHAPAAEKKFVDSSFGVERLPIMHNDFILIGPSADPAGVRKANSLAEAMQGISESDAGFISRGDDSGTHKKEKHLWQSAAITPHGAWYLSVGQGMGAVLLIAGDKLAYTLTDRGTYLSYRGKTDLEILYERVPELLNPYHVILVNPKRHPHSSVKLATKYVEFLQGKQGQDIIRNFTIGGEQLFYPDVIR
jgi:tungstate transport system substrate-binding protein